MNYKEKTFSVAPMMDWTDRHCRVFHRAISRHALLYTEMVTAQAVIHGDRERLLGFDEVEHPLVLQLGGSDPHLLAEAARIGEGFGYDAVNLNVGCPSDRVQGGHFGACLMAEPDLVARSVAVMQQAVRVPVTVKCRIGIDDQDAEADFQNFIRIVSEAGCDTFIVHARKAWLKGLSPKENREIPPLDYGRVHRLKASCPNLSIHLNGGLQDPAADAARLTTLDGLMYGRAAYHTPWKLHVIDDLCGEQAQALDHFAVIQALFPYLDKKLQQGVPLHSLTRHMLGLFHGQPGGRRWRQILSQQAHEQGAGLRVLTAALAAVGQEMERWAERCSLVVFL